MCFPLVHHMDDCIGHPRRCPLASRPDCLSAILLIRGAHRDEVVDDCADARRHCGVVLSNHLRLAAWIHLPVLHHSTVDGVDVGRDGKDALRGVGVRHHVLSVVQHEGLFGKAVLDCHQHNDVVTRRDR